MVKEYKEKPKRNPYLPIIGIVIVVALAVISFFLSPLLIEASKSAVGEVEFQQRLGSLGETELQAGFAFLIWIVLFAFSMLFVAAALGEDPAQKYRIVRPTENASDKEWRKYEKALAEQRKREEKVIERMKQQDK